MPILNILSSRGPYLNSLLHHFSWISNAAVISLQKFLLLFCGRAADVGLGLEGKILCQAELKGLNLNLQPAK